MIPFILAILSCAISLAVLAYSTLYPFWQALYQGCGQIALASPRASGDEHVPPFRYKIPALPAAA